MGEDPGTSPDFPRALGLADDEPVLVARLPRPASKIAENVTVVTSDDIARLNAHTLAEVLQTLPGVQLDQLQTPGSWTFFNILGSTSRHVLVQIDGVPQNFLSSDNMTDVGSIPVQMIDRVEVIKGAASAAWGSALGGVVNVFTKSPAPDRGVSGLASGSAGEHGTSDLRGEVSGTSHGFGYYLTGGKLRSSGLVPGNRAVLNHGFGKVVYALPSRGTVTLGIDARESWRGLEDSVSLDYHDNGGFRTTNGYLVLRYPLADRLTLDLTVRGGVRELTTKWGELSGPDLFLDSGNREVHRGGNVVLDWGDALHNLTAGIEYERDDLHGRELVGLAPENNFDLSLDRCSAYLNGTLSLGPLSILPGIRFTRTNLLDNEVSYTVGATLRLGDSTILRAYGARGYSMPIISELAVVNGQREMQDIWTVQAGVETTAIPYLWLKTTLFYNSIWNIQTFDASVIPATITLKEQIRQGVDAEVRTSAFYGFSLGAAYTFTDAYDKKTKEILPLSESAPRQTAKVALRYDNPQLGLTGTVTGNYAFWKSAPGDEARFPAPVWDLHLAQKVCPGRELSPELFLSLHNIFNGDQYQVSFRPNAPRWIEGGVRFRF